jgi:predicted secreted protein
MEHSRIFLLIAIVLLSFTASASAAGPKEKAAVITRNDNGKEIDVSQGETVEVRLEQHGATGYLWQIVDLDQSHLKVLESTDTPLKGGEIVGGPLLKTWKIQAVKAGQTDLKILLYRPWEGPAKAAESFQVKVLIK